MFVYTDELFCEWVKPSVTVLCMSVCLCPQVEEQLKLEVTYIGEGTPGRLKALLGKGKGLSLVWFNLHDTLFWSSTLHPEVGNHLLPLRVLTPVWLCQRCASCFWTGIGGTRSFAWWWTSLMWDYNSPCWAKNTVTLYTALQILSGSTQAFCHRQYGVS